MKRAVLSLLAALSVALSAGSTFAAPVKGIKKICPDGTTVPYKKPCPSGTPTTPPTTVPVLSVSNVSVSEAGGFAPVRITKTGTTTSTVTVNYSTGDNGATAGSDYTAIFGTLSIPASSTYGIVQIPITNDASDESDEVINFHLSSPTNATLANDYAAITILDNDDVVTPPATPSALTIADVQVNENAGTVTLTVSRSSANTSLNAGFTYSTTAVTATAGSDYTTTSGSGSLLAGLTTATFTVPIINDGALESNETFTVNIVAGSNATLSDGSATVTIIDNDTAPLPNPDPSPGGGDELAESLEGYTWRIVTDHDYRDDLGLSWGTGQIPGLEPGDVGAHRQVCDVNVLRYSDHILYYGEEGRSHLHDFNGHRGVNASSTFASLLASGESSCNSRPGTGFASQRSSYWTPAMLYGDSGEQTLRVNHVQLYYKREPESLTERCGHPSTGPRKHGICTEIPNGLKLIAGSKMVANQYGPAGYRTDAVEARPTYFMCHEVPGKFKNLADVAATYNSSQCKTLQASINMPECWDGKYLWKTDRSHVVYGGYSSGTGYIQCPPTHPYNITHVSIFYVYNVTGLDLTKLKLASDYMDPTQPAGWSLHADLHIVWDARVKRIMHDNCINKRLSCSGGDLGNGLQLKGQGNGNIKPTRFETTPPMPENMVMP